jgi:molybdate transport system substrate-binding protein
VTGRFAIAVALIALAGCQNHGSQRIDVVAAASLRHALPEIVAAFSEHAPERRVTVRYGGSDELASLAATGSGIDLVLLADRHSLEAVRAAGKIGEDSVRRVAGNTLVLAGRPGTGGLTFAKLDALPAHVKIGIADPASVPAGRYAEAYLRGSGSWPRVEASAVFAGDVAAVAAMAARGEVAAAIVYETDVALPLVLLDRAHGSDAPRPEVVGAVLRGSDAGAAATELLDFVTSPTGREILVRHRFTAP